MNKLKKFTMEEVDAEIMQIVQQQTGEVEAVATGQPNIMSAIMNRAKAKRNGNNANAEIPKL